MRIHGLIASVAFTAALAVSGAAYAFETTSVGNTNPGGSAQFQDPDEQALKGPLGGIQFGVTSNGNDSAADDSARPPWEIKPPPPSQGFFGSPMSGPPLFRPGQ
jgi:hypothetical protein